MFGREPYVSIHLSSFAMSASLFRDASKGAEMRNHLVRERPLGHAEMTRTEFIMLAAGWSTALVAVSSDSLVSVRRRR
jgi:hypothetical protein